MLSDKSEKEPMSEVKEFEWLGQQDTDLEILYEVYHDALLLVIWKIFPDWKVAEEILKDVFCRLRKASHIFPVDEEQLYCLLARICRNATLKNIPFLFNNSHY